MTTAELQRLTGASRRLDGPVTDAGSDPADTGNTGNTSMMSNSDGFDETCGTLFLVRRRHFCEVTC